MELPSQAKISRADPDDSQAVHFGPVHTPRRSREPPGGGNLSYPFSATFFYPPPSFTQFTRPDEVEVHGDEVPEDILPCQEDELN